MKKWIHHLRRFGVYFSEPLDLDMSMLKAFPDAYKALPEGAKGPAGDAEEACRTVLGSGGNRALCSELQDDDFLWYRYLFITRSKPATHLYALSFIDSLDLSLDAPGPISSLLAHVDNALADLDTI